MVFWRVHALYLSADSLIYVKSLSVVSYDCNSALHVSHVTPLLGIHVIYSAWNPKDKYDMSPSVFVVQFNGFMSLTSSFDVKYKY